MVATKAQTIDPFDAAEQAQAPNTNRHYFGQIGVDAWLAALVKGQGKVVFDPNQHSDDQRVTAIDITLTPLPRPGVTQYSVKREMIAESNEWVKIVKPSLAKLGVQLRNVHGRFVEVELVDTGRRYTNKNGEEKTLTTFRFLALFNTRDECQAAADRFFANRNAHGNASASEESTSTPAVQQPNGSPAERAMAAKFLPALFKTAQAQAAAANSADVVSYFLAVIQANPLTSKHFDLNSPEVIAILSPA